MEKIDLDSEFKTLHRLLENLKEGDLLAKRNLLANFFAMFERNAIFPLNFREDTHICSLIVAPNGMSLKREKHFQDDGFFGEFFAPLLFGYGSDSTFTFHNKAETEKILKKQADTAEEQIKVWKRLKKQCNELLQKTRKGG